MPVEPLIVIANEFFDALPIEQHIYDNGSWRRRLVSLNEAGELAFSMGRLALPPIELIPAEAPRQSDILEHRPPLPRSSRNSVAARSRRPSRC